MYRIIALIFILILLFSLQVFLCKRENRKTGLILPALTFIISILAVIGVHLYSPPPNFVSMIYLWVQVFVAMNVPTVILAGIYILYHGRRM
ncbi:hypothetical protein [Methanimicrococcus blatticola]|uniref:Uncharacterized protein n=1 Tax=Methanimicrococcus blatticola TaxID=91560 RepID=A0A484F664_9EURY|nr:hypothetical protein [Methanimicrococcus blatticola]MBZ3934914.1 hypothetical protein [Methanimicrococcus blatticola]MCC2508987.1 hypothetical protein [Methanimicrococcus blatticola]TDQ70983.1 hypothetical protein C7391_0081 [Methanimicrococcus blatticola]